MYSGKMCLDRDIQDLRRSQKRIDEVIYRKWLRDREQDIWLEQNKMTLVRLTDKEIISKKQSLFELVDKLFVNSVGEKDGIS